MLYYHSGPGLTIIRLYFYFLYDVIITFHRHNDYDRREKLHPYFLLPVECDYSLILKLWQPIN